LNPGQRRAAVDPADHSGLLPREEPRRRADQLHLDPVQPGGGAGSQRAAQRTMQPRVPVQVQAGRGCPHCLGSQLQPVEHQMGSGPQQLLVLAAGRLAFRAVADDDRPGPHPGDGGELAGGREPGAAAAGEPRRGDHLDQLPRPAVGRRAVGAQVGVQVHSLQQPGQAAAVGAIGVPGVPRQGAGGGHRGRPCPAAWRPAARPPAASSSALTTRRKRGTAVIERRSRYTAAAATAVRQSTVTASSQPD
jgi:hypothetical protein